MPISLQMFCQLSTALLCFGTCSFHYRCFVNCQLLCSALGHAHFTTDVLSIVNCSALLWDMPISLQMFCQLSTARLCSGTCPFHYRCFVNCQLLGSALGHAHFTTDVLSIVNCSALLWDMPISLQMFCQLSTARLCSGTCPFHYRCFVNCQLLGSALG